MKERIVSMNEPLSTKNTNGHSENNHKLIYVLDEDYGGGTDTREWEGELGGTNFLPSCEEFISPLLRAE